MARECTICGKGSQMQGRYSNKVRATKYNPTGKIRRYPNIQFMRLPDGMRVKACTQCMKKAVRTTTS